MPKSRDPFRGVNLADHVFPTAARDQRLFAPAPQPPAQRAATPTPKSLREQEPTNVVSNVPTKERSKETTNEGTNVPRKDVSNVPQGEQEDRPIDANVSRWRITARPGHRTSFDFTDEELDALEDVKRDAHRQHDLRTTKQDLVRHAVHNLLSDYEEHGEQSWIIQKLRKR